MASNSLPIVTPPQAANLRITGTAGQTFNSGVSTTIVYSNVAYNNGFSFNAGTGEVTVLVDGSYQIDANFYGHNGSGLNSMSTVINGTASQMSYKALSAGFQQTVEINNTINLLAGDIITIEYFQNSGVAYTASTADLTNWLTINKIG